MTSSTSEAVFARVREFVLALPGVTEGVFFGTPSFKAGKRFFTRLRDDGDTLVVRVGYDEREMLMTVEPGTFYLTDHYRPGPWLLVRLSRVHEPTLYRLLEQNWRAISLKRVVKAYDAAKAASQAGEIG